VSGRKRPSRIRRSVLTALVFAAVVLGRPRGHEGPDRAPGGHNGCDTGEDVLRRDLTRVTGEPGSDGCVVVTGVLTEPYTAQGLRFQRGTTSTAEVQIHHVVALSDAWQTGTQYWAGNLRVDFGNDPLNLLTGDGRTNGAKDDGDGASWLPANKACRLRLCGSNRGREGA
jgi:hypothetical protein